MKKPKKPHCEYRGACKELAAWRVLAFVQTDAMALVGKPPKLRVFIVCVKHAACMKAPGLAARFAVYGMIVVNMARIAVAAPPLPETNPRRTRRSVGVVPMMEDP